MNCKNYEPPNGNWIDSKILGHRHMVNAICKDCKNYEPIAFPIHSTLFGKSLEYWTDLDKRYKTLDLINSALYDDLKKAREELEHIKRVMPARIGGWDLGKPLSYWEKLESSWSSLAEENTDLKRRNDNLQDRINNALDYQKPRV